MSKKYRGPIKSEEDYAACLRALGLLMDDERNVGDLGELIGEYEECATPIDYPPAIAAIRFRCDQLGVAPSSALKGIIGSSGKISQVLRGQIPLNLRMVRALHKSLGIPLEVLCAEPALSPAPTEEPQPGEGSVQVDPEQEARYPWLKGRTDLRYKACGGCGTSNPQAQCLGCLHPWEEIAAEPQPEGREG